MYLPCVRQSEIKPTTTSYRTKAKSVARTMNQNVPHEPAGTFDTSNMLLLGPSLNGGGNSQFTGLDADGDCCVLLVGTSSHCRRR